MRVSAGSGGVVSMKNCRSVSPVLWSASTGTVSLVAAATTVIPCPEPVIAQGSGSSRRALLMAGRKVLLLDSNNLWVLPETGSETSSPPPGVLPVVQQMHVKYTAYYKESDV